MKATGMIRKVDELGRVVLPIEIRRGLKIAEKDPLEIFVDKDSIILKKYTADKQRLLTGEIADDNISLADGKLVFSRESAEYVFNHLQQKLGKKNG